MIHIGDIFISYLPKFWESKAYSYKNTYYDLKPVEVKNHT
jgi:hypothetical protein